MTEGIKEIKQKSDRLNKNDVDPDLVGVNEPSKTTYLQKYNTGGAGNSLNPYDSIYSNLD
jgi:hypothetical protein